MKNEPAAGRRCINLLGERLETDAPGFEVIHGLDQMRHRPTEPIELPNHENIAVAHIAQSVGKSRPIRLGAGDLVLEHGRAASRVQSISLQV